MLRNSRGGIQYVEHAEGDEAKMFKAACKLGLGRDRFKETESVLPLGSVENLD